MPNQSCIIRRNCKKLRYSIASAYTVYDKLTRLEPDNANLYFNKAKIFYEWESNPDALQEIEESLRLEPDLEEALILKDKILQKSYYAMSCYG